MNLSWNKSLIAWCLCLFVYPSVGAEKLEVPQNSREKINFWLPHVVSIRDPMVLDAQRIFRHLLQSWDQSRVEPALAVVKSADGAWAASLADGHILLSYSALQMIKKIQPETYKDALAFVLAHELAHQRNDDLWHHRFFRTQLQNAKTVKRSNQDDFKSRRIKEIQADQEALLLMTVSGFNPTSVIGENDFFNAWLKMTSEYQCSVNPNAEVCKFARQRAFNAKEKIHHIYRQKTWYDLGMMMIAKADYLRARKYLTSFAREYPHWRVYNALAVSYLLEAINLKHTKNEMAGDVSEIYLMLSRVNLTKLKQAERTRAGSSARLLSKTELLNQSLHFLEKSQFLQARNSETLYLICVNYLLQNNLPMAQGILEGKLIKLTGSSVENMYLRALLDIKSGDLNSADHKLKIAEKMSVSSKNKALKYAILLAQINLEKNRGNILQSEKKLERFVDLQNSRGNSLEFQWGLNQLKVTQDSGQSKEFPELTELKKKLGEIQPSRENTLWLEGEPYTHKLSGVNQWLVDKDDNLMFSWCNIADCLPSTGNVSLDRILARFGYPDSVQHLAGLRYLAYQNSNLVISMDQGFARQIFSIH